MSMAHPRLLLTHPMVLLRDKPRRAYDIGDEGEKAAIDLCGLKAAGIEIDDVTINPTP